MQSIILVCGASRSGSTMLDLIIGNATDAFSCGEVYAWFRPFRKHHFKISCSCGVDPCGVWEKIKKVRENEFHISAMRELGVNHIIDSSKDICWVIDAQKWGGHNHLEVRNLLIWKDPVDHAYSYWKRGYKVDYWKKSFIGYYLKFINSSIPFISINYTELINNPSQLTEKICKMIDIPYFSGKERFWEKNHHCLFGSGGVKKQLERGNSEILTKPFFSDSYASQIVKFQDQIMNDADIQKILFSLQENDINNQDVSTGTVQEKTIKRIQPVWYYRKKIQNIIRRYFPENYESSKFQEVETVPEVNYDDMGSVENEVVAK